MTDHPLTTRRYDLDWLRIIAVFLLVPFHSALIFSTDPNSIVYFKAMVNSPALVSLAGFINLWHMPLLFVIAGASTCLALRFRSSSQYIAERTLRLLIPAVVGLVTLVPTMTYVHFLGRANAPSFWQHYLGFFHINPEELTGISGAFTPAHLWFILFLYVFSLAALPLFRSMSKPGGLGAIFQHRLSLVLWVIPLVLTAALPILGDKNPVHYLLYFVLGYILIYDERIQMGAQRDWLLYLGMAAAGTMGYFFFRPQYGYPEWSPSWIAFGILFEFTRWTWVIAILGAGRRWLNLPGPALRYCSEAAFPFYILHLPVNTLIAWALLRFLPGPIGVEYFLIVVLTCLVTWAIYELVVRRIKLLRLLFGVKAKKTAPVVVPQPARLPVTGD